MRTRKNVQDRLECDALQCAREPLVVNILSGVDSVLVALDKSLNKSTHA